MKVYDRKTLLITLFGGGALVAAVAVMLLLRGFDFLRVFWLLYALKLIWNGLRASLTKAGYKENQSRATRGKRVYKKLFGRMAPVIPYSVVIVYLTTLCLISLSFHICLKNNIILPSWIFCLMILIPVGYAVWFGWIVSKHMDLEEEQEFLQANDPSATAEDIRSESHEF